MLLFGLRKSDRLRVEAFVGLLLALVTVAFPAAWWFKILLVSLLAGISVHLIFSSPTTLRFKTISKVGMSLVAIAIIVMITWYSTQSRQLEVKQPAATAIVQEPKRSPGLFSDPAQSNESLKSDTAGLVRQLRDFQQKVDDW